MSKGTRGVNNALQKADIAAAAIHGNKSQNARTKALSGFKSGQVRVMVATDIAARGLDIPLLPHVINFELPNVPEDYVHRIGRTGRAGASGEAISLVSHDEKEYVRGIEKLLKQELPIEVIEGFEPSLEPEKEERNTNKRSFQRSKSRNTSGSNNSRRFNNSRSNDSKSNGGGNRNRGRRS